MWAVEYENGATVISTSVAFESQLKPKGGKPSTVIADSVIMVFIGSLKTTFRTTAIGMSTAPSSGYE